MIVVKVEMWPGGGESRSREIGRTYIANTGGSAKRGDYRVHTCRRGSTATDRRWLGGHDVAPPKSCRTGEVKDYPRQAYNMWRLIVRALLACFPEESKR